MKTFLTTFLNTGTTYETFQHTGQQDTFRNLLKSSASMYQISGSNITIFGVMEILCSFRLALEVETIEEIPDSSRLEFLEKY